MPKLIQGRANLPRMAELADAADLKSASHSESRFNSGCGDQESIELNSLLFAELKQELRKYFNQDNWTPSKGHVPQQFVKFIGCVACEKIK